MSKRNNIEIRLKGLALSEGCATARVCMFNESRHSNLPMYRVEGDGVEREMERVRRAISVAGERLDKIRADVEREIGVAEAEIFVAHRMILEDPVLSNEVFQLIRDEQVNAEAAVTTVLDMYEEKMLALDSEYIRERASDFGEIKRRLLDVLGNMQLNLQCDTAHCHRGRNRVVVAEELTPSLTVEVDTQHTLAFVTERGGVNSHAAILARALGIPAVSGIQGVHSMVGCGTELLVNGNTGEIIIWPSEETVENARLVISQPMKMPPARAPVEGFKVMANIGMASEVSEALEMQAEGVGLYRTEFEVMVAGRMFSEDELYERYLSVGQAMAGTMVIFRLFDLGSDKSASFLNVPREDNPSLGWRGARLLLGHPDLLRIQARALARVSVGGRVHVMYPMIVDVAQYREIRTAFMEAVSDIDCGEIRHGIMFEVPSACLQAEELFREVDFACIGTNDLTQYLFAVDRDNELVSYDYDPDRPVFWSLLRSIAEAARTAEKPLSICGELAGDPRFLTHILAMGITSVSVSARRIPRIRRACLEQRDNISANETAVPHDGEQLTVATPGKTQ